MCHVPKQCTGMQSADVPDTVLPLCAAAAAGQELVQAMQRAQVQLAPAEAQHLAVALQNNLGLLNYKKLTRQLKGRVSRPASALAAPATAPAAEGQGAAVTAVGEASAMRQQQQQKGAAEAQRWQRPQTALPGSRLSSGGDANGRSMATGPTQEACSKCSNNSATVCGSKLGSSRPSSAPARPSKAGTNSCSNADSAAAAFSTREEYVCASAWRQSNREGVSAVPHWFCGSRRDAAVAGEAVHWRPGHAADAMTKGWGLNGPAPWDGAPAETCCAGGAAADRAAASAVIVGAVSDWACGDVVPAWMIGADALHGTCRIGQPFGQTMQSAGQTAAAVEDDQHVADSRDGAVMQQAQAVGRGGQWKPRPASAGPCCRQPDSPSCYQQQQQQPGQLLSWGQGSVRGGQAGRQQLQRPKSAVLGGCSPTRASGSSKPQGLSVDLGHAELVIAGRSSSRVGLAERRRLVEGQKQDLLAVRMLA